MSEAKEILCFTCKHNKDRECAVGMRILSVGNVYECTAYVRHDPISHPKHYNAGKIEAITVIEDWNLGFNLGNAVKYIARADHKGDKIQDLEKARWYLDREINNLKELKKDILG